MPNPNIEAIAEALRGLLPRFSAVDAGEERHLHTGSDDPWWECYDCIRSLAEWLAAGPTPLLAISDAVLTDEQCQRVWDAAAEQEEGYSHNRREMLPGAVFAHPDRMRGALSRLAKGE